MKPTHFLGIRDIGDTDTPYWMAASTDGASAVLEPHEQLLTRGIADVKLTRRTQKATLENSTWEATGHRLVFHTTRHDTGGGWVGFGPVGLAVATTANVVSKRQAAARSAGKITIGQMRYEWVMGVRLEEFPMPISHRPVVRCKLISYDDQGPVSLDLSGRAFTWDHGVWLAAAIAAHRLTLGLPMSDDTQTKVEAIIRGEYATTPFDAHGRATEFKLPFSADRMDDLIAAGYHQAMQA